MLLLHFFPADCHPLEEIVTLELMNHIWIDEQRGGKGFD